MLSLDFSAFLRSSLLSAVPSNFSFILCYQRSPFSIACDYKCESHSLAGLDSAPGQISYMTLGACGSYPNTGHSVSAASPWSLMSPSSSHHGYWSSAGHSYWSLPALSWLLQPFPGLPDLPGLCAAAQFLPPPSVCSCFSTPARFTAQRKFVGNGVYDRLSQMRDKTPVLLWVMTLLVQCCSGRL